MDLHTVSAVVPASGATWGDGDAFLAGGTWLFSEPQPGTSRLLDLQAFGWPALVAGEAGLEIAATCTLASLAAWVPPPEWPAGRVARSCCDALLGSFKVWNEATVGGNICLALPAGPMTALTAALGGVATIWAADGTARTAPMTDVVIGARRTALGPGELLRSVLLPAAWLTRPAAFRQLSLSTYGRSAVLVIGALAPDGDVVVTVTASTPRPVRFSVRADIGAQALAEVLDSAVLGPAPPDSAAPGTSGWYDDVHGAPAWRAAMTHRLVGEVVAELAGLPGAGRG